MLLGTEGAARMTNFRGPTINSPERQLLSFLIERELHRKYIDTQQVWATKHNVLSNYLHAEWVNAEPIGRV